MAQVFDEVEPPDLADERAKLRAVLGFPAPEPETSSEAEPEPDALVSEAVDDGAVIDVRDSLGALTATVRELARGVEQLSARLTMLELQRTDPDVLTDIDRKLDKLLAVDGPAATAIERGVATGSVDREIGGLRAEMHVVSNDLRRLIRALMGSTPTG